jgi:hypothetical protein
MLAKSGIRRNRHKIAFLKRHRNFANQAFQEAEELHQKGEDVRKASSVNNLINLARVELKYSVKTYSKDIFWGLMKANYKLLEEEENDG